MEHGLLTLGRPRRPDGVFGAAAGWQRPGGGRAWAAAGVTGLLLGATTLLVYHTGGTHLAYVHLLYLPIILGGYFFGLSGGVVIGLLAGLCVGPWMPLAIEQNIQQSTFNWVSRTGFFMLTGAVVGVLCSSLARQTERVRRHGYYDPLTGLPNRVRLLSDLDAVIDDGGSREGSGLVLLVVGLPHFETVLATLGHRHADLLLARAAERLLAKLPEDASLYLLGGGNYAVPLISRQYEDAIDTGRRLLQALEAPFLIDNVPVLSGGEFGIAGHPHHGTEGRSLLRAAIAARHDAQRRRQPHAVYDDAADRAQREIALLLPDLQAAFHRDDQLELHYQPKVRIDNGDCIGVEALIRWRHPRRGMVPPAQFVSLAEQTALIGSLTDWTIGTALRQLATWQRAGVDLSIAVNISARDLENAAFPGLIADQLRFHAVEPSRLEIEVTESAFMASPALASQILAAVRGLGVTVALDDFGCGHSSLSYLRDLPADTVKLDRSFLRDLGVDSKSQMIVGSMIDMARQLGFKVIAEGVETQPIYDRLRELSCDIGQGYHIARPMPVAALQEWLRTPETHAHRQPQSVGYLPPFPKRK